MSNNFRKIRPNYKKIEDVFTKRNIPKDLNKINKNIVDLNNLNNIKNNNNGEKMTTLNNSTKIDGISLNNAIDSKNKQLIQNDKIVQLNSQQNPCRNIKKYHHDDFSKYKKPCNKKKKKNKSCKNSDNDSIFSSKCKYGKTMTSESFSDFDNSSNFSNFSRDSYSSTSESSKTSHGNVMSVNNKKIFNDCNSENNSSCSCSCSCSSFDDEGCENNPSKVIIKNNNYVFAYDTTSQQILNINTFYDVRFNVNRFMNGWGHQEGTPQFINYQKGKYLIEYSLQILTTGVPANVVTRLVKGTNNSNFQEIEGSKVFILIPQSSVGQTVMKSIIVEVGENEIIKVQVSSDKNSIRLSSNNIPNISSTSNSAVIVIHRLL